MAKHKIEIEGTTDLSSVSKAFTDFHKLVEDAFGADGLNIVDEKSIIFLKGEAQNAFNKLAKSAEKLKKEAKELDSAIKSSTGDQEKQERLSAEMLDNIRKTVAVEREMFNLRRAQNIIETGQTPEKAAKNKAQVEKQATKEQAVAVKKATQLEKLEQRQQTIAVKQRLKLMSDEDRKRFLEQRSRERAAKADDKSKAKTLASEEAKAKKAESVQEREEERGKLKEERRNKFQKYLAVNTITSGAEGVASELPAVGQAFSVGKTGINAASAGAEAGLGVGAMAGLGLLAAAAGIAAIAITRMSEGFQLYLQQVPKLLTLASMGVKPMRDSTSLDQAAQLGYDEPQIFDFEKSAAHAFGAAPNAKAGQNRMMNTLTASRAMGVSPEEIFGGADQLRKVGGTETSMKQMSTIIEKAMTSGMDKTQSSAYLAAAVGFLSDMNQNGATNTDRMLSVMSDLVGKGNMSPEQAAKSLGGISNAISGSSGESNAFFQTAYSQAGLGGGSIVGLQEAISQGLNPIDTKALNKQVGDTGEGRAGIAAIHDMGLDSADFTQKAASGILANLNDRFIGKEMEGAKLKFVGENFGAKTAGDQTKVLGLLEKLRDGGKATKQDQKFMDDLSKDPVQGWREDVVAQLKLIAGAAQVTAGSQARATNAKVELGEASSGIFNRLTDIMTKVDATLAGFASGAGKTVDDHGGFGGTVMDALTTPSKWFQEFLDAVTQADIGKIIGDAFVATVKNIWGGLGDAATKGGEITHDVIGAVGGATTAGIDGIMNGADQLANTIGNAVKSFLGNATMAAPVNVNVAPTPVPAPVVVNASSGGSSEDVVHAVNRNTAVLEKVVRQGGIAPKANRQQSRQP